VCFAAVVSGAFGWWGPLLREPLALNFWLRCHPLKRSEQLLGLLVRACQQQLLGLDPLEGSQM
jgi:hypothetical protein